MLLREATIIASSSTDKTVEQEFLGSVGRSSPELRFLHLATVLILMHKRLDNAIKLS